MPTIYRNFGKSGGDPYAGHFDFSGSKNAVFGRNASRDITTWLRGYEVFPISLGLTGVLPDQYIDKNGNVWKKFDVVHVATNSQFTNLGLGGKFDAGGTIQEHGQTFTPQTKEKYPPEDENKGIFMLRQTSYLNEQIKRGLIKP